MPTNPVAAEFVNSEATRASIIRSAALARLFPLAKQGDAEAQFQVAALLAEGGHRNYTEAVTWYRLAARQGHPAAQNGIGIMYSSGRGVPQDSTEAAKWYRLAAEQGYVMAQYNLGRNYLDGVGVPQDYVLAHMWFNLAASRWQPGQYGDDVGADRDIFTVTPAQIAEGLGAARDYVASLMTPAQIAEAQKLAREWAPKAQ